MTKIQRYEMNHKGLPEPDDNGVWVFRKEHDAIVDALQEQVQKLAAENNKLIGWVEMDSMSKVDMSEFDATDAVIREIGAKAVDAFGIYHNFSDKQLVQVEAKKYAAKLRAGEQP